MAADFVDAILAAEDLPEKILEIPEWGASGKPRRIGIRGLTVNKALEIEAARATGDAEGATRVESTKALVLSLQFSIFDPADGKLKFSEAQARKLFEKSQKVVLDILSEITALAPTLKKATANFTPPPASDSRTNSRSGLARRRPKSTNSVTVN